MAGQTRAAEHEKDAFSLKAGFAGIVASIAIGQESSENFEEHREEERGCPARGRLFTLYFTGPRSRLDCTRVIGEYFRLETAI